MSEPITLDFAEMHGDISKKPLLMTWFLLDHLPESSRLDEILVCNMRGKVGNFSNPFLMFSQDSEGLWSDAFYVLVEPGGLQ